MKRLFSLLCILLGTLSLEGTHFYLGPHFNYTRINFVMPEKIDGYLWGVTAGAVEYFNCFSADVHFEGSWDTNYLRGDPAQKAEIKDYLLEARIGYSWEICPDVCGHVRVGYGWNRFEYVDQPGSNEALVRYTKHSIPIGFTVESPLSCNSTLGVFFEWRPDVGADFSVASIDLDIKKENAYRLEVPYKFYTQTRCGCMKVTIAPFYDWSRFGQASGTVEGNKPVVVPSLKRWSLGLRMLFGMDY